MNNSFKNGFKNGIPICIGYFPVAFAFGIFAVDSGLSVLQATILSFTNMTSAGQLAGVPIITGAGSLAELALSQFVINSRYALMSVSLSQKFSSTIKFKDKLLIAFANTDEIFAVAISNKEEIGKNYLWGLRIPPIIGWTLGTLAGGIAGNILPAIVVSALGLAIYGMFVAIVVPVAKKEKTTAACVFLAIALSCLFYYLPILQKVPTGFVVVICAVTASVIFALLAPIDTEKEVTENA